MVEKLTSRENQILALTVEDYIDTAIPVASTRVKMVNKLPFSPATIRNTMAGLERWGYLMHPYTSSGKIPTDKGYRTYVNSLMVLSELDAGIKIGIGDILEEVSGSVERHLDLIAHLIAQITGGIGVVVSPVDPRTKLIGIKLAAIGSGRVLLVLELDSGAVRSVMAEVQDEEMPVQLSVLEEILCERLCGLTLSEIGATIEPRLKATLAEKVGLTAFIIERAAELFSTSLTGEIEFYGLEHILASPEFVDQSNVSALIGLLEDENRLRAYLMRCVSQRAVRIDIGAEIGEENLETFTIITRRYLQGASFGTIAVIAPKRVNYAQAIATLEFVSEGVSDVGLNQDL